MKLFTTISGSLYEYTDRAIRRVRGLHEPTPRQGEDGEWREYFTMSEPRPGKPVVVMWDVVRATVTAEVRNVYDLPVDGECQSGRP